MDGHLVISNNNGLLRVRHDRLVYATADGNYCNVMLMGGEIRTLTIQLADFEGTIDRQLGQFRTNFIRVGRSLIINRTLIRQIDIKQNQITLCDLLENPYSVKASRAAIVELKELIDKEYVRHK